MDQIILSKILQNLPGVNKILPYLT